MKTLLTSLLSVAALVPCLAEDRPLWLRRPAVSPDGQSIAFTWQGQLWKVPAAGGEAIPLTIGDIPADHAVWSPDSQHIAFSSAQYGNDDVFIMPAAGGEMRRLTTHSQADTPLAFTPDGKSVLFNSMRPGDAKAAMGGALMGTSQQLYSVPVTGGRERMVMALPALDAAPQADGRFILYTDLKSSEKSGSFNVWTQSFEGDAKPQQVTFHQTHPVRFLSRAGSGDLVYGYDGEIWRLTAGAKEPQRVAVKITRGTPSGTSVNVRVNDEASELAASADGSLYAVVARGEIFVVEATGGRTRRITSTPQHERNVSFHPRPPHAGCRGRGPRRATGGRHHRAAQPTRYQMSP